MNSHQPVRISQNVPTQYYGQGGDIPGVTQATPIYPEVHNPFLPAVAKPASASNNILSNLNFKEIKGFVDRMGGIEGVMSALTKVQKTMQTFQQMAPMLKLLLPKLGGAKSASLDDDDYYRPRRRRRRKMRRKASSTSYSRTRTQRIGARAPLTKRKRRKSY